MTSIEALGPDVQAKVNDDWREWYINYRGLTNLLLEAECNSMIEGEGMLHISNPSFRGARKQPSGNIGLLNRGASSMTTLLSSRPMAILERINERLFGGRASALAMPSSVKVKRRLMELLRSSSEVPAMRREVSLFEVDTWLESRTPQNVSQRHLPEPVVTDQNVQVRLHVCVAADLPVDSAIHYDAIHLCTISVHSVRSIDNRLNCCRRGCSVSLFVCVLVPTDAYHLMC